MFKDMPCHITDNPVFLEDEADNEEKLQLDLMKLNMFDLMAEEHYIYLTKSQKFGYDMIVENDEYMFTETEIHPCAIDEMASFCRNFLAQYERMSQE